MDIAHSVLLAHLQSIADLPDEDDRDAVLNLPMEVRVCGANQDIVREGDRPSRSCVLIEGFAATTKLLAAGGRQICAYHIPGDVPDLQSLHLTVMDSSLTTLTACKIGLVEHRVLHELCRRYPDLASALWRMTLIDAAIFREWIANVGQRAALGRTAHLFAETFYRMHAVGLTEKNRCPLGLTQVRLAEATGMSTVHVNRTIHSLRDGIADLHHGRLEVLNWQKLKRVGDFDPGYLHIRHGREPL